MPAPYSWKPIYREIAEKLLSYKQRQGELIALLKELAAQDLKVVKTDDQFADGSRGDLKEIDPFTFFAAFNRDTSKETRLAILAEIKKRWNISAPLPEKFDGLPVMNNMNSWFIRYAAKRSPTAVADLWDLAEAALRAKKPTDVPAALIDKCLRPSKGNLTSLTMGMFWFNPEQFPALDWKNQSQAENAGIKWDEDQTSGSDYLAWAAAIHEKYGSDLAGFSHSAHHQATADDDAAGDGIGEANSGANAGAVKPTLLKIAPGEGAEYWDSDCLPQGIMCVGWDDVGDLRLYSNFDDFRKAFEKAYAKGYNDHQGTVTRKAKEVWMLRDVKAGDLIAANRGTREILAVGEVVPPGYVWDAARSGFRHTIKVRWDQSRSGPIEPQKRWATVTVENIDGELRDTILALHRDAPATKVAEAAPSDPLPTPYAAADALADLFMSETQLAHLFALLGRKKNLILQGPPGVGKTFAAERIAFAFLGVRDHSRVQRVQFHPSYGYEDFIQGIRPRKGGMFELQDGAFLKFCDAAAQDPDRSHVFVIDEINRGDLSKILGEAMMLLEPDKRGAALPLMYEPERKFSIPKNVFVIGTMNTADRSISLVDYALRRRFAFHDLRPGFGSEAFAEHLAKCARPAGLIARVRERIGELNKEISEDTRNLGAGYEIGHSYFCGTDQADQPEQWFEDIITYEVEPLLREYWIDQPDRLNKALEKLRAK